MKPYEVEELVLIHKRPITQLEIEEKGLEIIEEKFLDFVNDVDICSDEIEDFIHEFDVMKLAYIGAKARVKALKERKSCIE